MSTKTTDYAGIDYSCGNGSNVDAQTGIHYGMIAQNSVMPEALDDVFSHGKDLGYENAEAELKAELKRALRDYFHGERLDNAVDNAFDALDGWADNLDSSGPWYYESEETVQTTERGELWVFKSHYYTFTQYCSPCVPGAGNLDSPCPTGPKTYCLGHDWFEGGRAPYPVYSAKDGSVVEPETKGGE